MPRRRKGKPTGILGALSALGVLGMMAIPATIGPLLIPLLMVASIVGFVILLTPWLIRKLKAKPEPVQHQRRVRTFPIRSEFDPTKPSVGELPPEAYQPPDMREQPAANPPPLYQSDVQQKVEELDWYQFEKFVAALFRAGGCEVQSRGGGKADGGVDLLVYVNEVPCAVQCKHWANWKCGVQTVREMLGTMAHEQIPQAYIIAKTFTEDAKSLAEQHGIALVSRARLVEWTLECLNFEEVRETLLNPPKVCPACGSSMKLRTARKGRRAGKDFWSCSRYPRCSGTINIHHEK